MSDYRVEHKHKAYIENDNLVVRFYRTYQIEYMYMSTYTKPLDDFKIIIEKIDTQKTSEPCKFGGNYSVTNKKVVDSLTIKTNKKEIANYIWYVSKHGATFEQIKEMYETHKF